MEYSTQPVGHTKHDLSVLTGSESGLVLYYNFNQIDDIFIKDISGTINDGDIRSGCKWVQRTNSDLNIVKKHWGNDKVTYNVTLKTGNVSGGGTDSNIWIKIYGSLQTVTLHDGKAINSLVSGNAFERNDTDSFSWYGLDPGNIYQVCGLMMPMPDQTGILITLMYRHHEVTGELNFIGGLKIVIQKLKWIRHGSKECSENNVPIY